MQNQKKLLWLFLFLLFFGIITKRAEAAKIYFDPAENSISEKDQLQARIYIDTRGQNINALEMTIAYPTDLLRFVQNFEKDSIISLWVETPKEKESGKIHFAGLIPGGFLGEKGLVGTLIFENIKKGNGKLEVSDLAVLLNDKKGTKLSSVANDLFFSAGLVSGDANARANVDLIVTDDNTPPEKFKAEIVRFGDLFDGKWTIVFEAKDNESGISHYEIQETKDAKIAEDEWEKIERGPYLLADQKLRSYIHIRAIDKKGNIQTTILPPKKPSNPIIFIGIVLVIISLVIYKIKSKK